MLYTTKYALEKKKVFVITLEEKKIFPKFFSPIWYLRLQFKLNGSLEVATSSYIKKKDIF